MNYTFYKCPYDPDTGALPCGERPECTMCDWCHFATYKAPNCANSDLSNQSSETLVFSRKIGILILVPYVFSLVFALMSRNKGNFLFRLPRPPYQAVLRKFVSLPS